MALSKVLQALILWLKELLVFLKPLPYTPEEYKRDVEDDEADGIY